MFFYFKSGNARRLNLQRFWFKISQKTEPVMVTVSSQRLGGPGTKLEILVAFCMAVLAKLRADG